MTDDAPTAKRPEVDRTEHHAALTAGVMIGRYRIESVLGLGGFGITYRCYDTHLRRDVAVKEYLPTGIAIRHESSTVLPRSTEMSTDFVWGRNRFLDEARTIAKLGHVPAVVRVHDFLEAFGTAYVVMELLSGETMSQRLKSEPRLSQETIDRILPPLLDGLEQIHTAGFLHRDIKPANIVLGPGDAATLIDFGASRVAIADRSQALTAVFTPGYAAPEQSTSGKQGPWTDIYGLAATLFTAVTGKVPPSVMERVFEGASVIPAEASVNGYSANLLTGIDAGLRLPIEARPQDIAAWRQILFGKEESPVAQAVPPATLSVSPPPAALPLPPASPVIPPNRLRYGVVAGAVVVALALGYALFALTARDQRPAIASAPTPAAASPSAGANGSGPYPPAATLTSAPAQSAAAPAASAPVTTTTSQPAPLPPAVPAPASTAVAPAPPPDASPAPVAASPPASTATPPAAVTPPAASIAPPPLPAATPAPAVVPPPASAAPPPSPPATPAPSAAAPPDPTPAPTPATSPRPAAPGDTTVPVLDDLKVQDADSRAIEEVQSRRDRPAQEAARPDEPKKSEEQLKAEAEQAETALKLSTRDRQKIQVALTSLGFDAGGADGVFGPRTRTRIADWQSANGEPPTGFISADNKTTLVTKAAPAIARWEEAQRRAWLEEQRRLEELRKPTPAPSPPPKRTWRWPWEDRTFP